MSRIMSPVFTRRLGLVSAVLLGVPLAALLSACLLEEDTPDSAEESDLFPRLVLPDGTPAAGAIVLVFAPGDTSESTRYSAVADGDGRFVLEEGLTPGTYDLNATLDDRSLQLASLPLPLASRRVDTLSPSGSIVGKVRLPQGDDASDVTVILLGTGRRTKTNLSGQFFFPLVPPGDQRVLVEAPPSFLPFTSVVHVPEGRATGPAVVEVDLIRVPLLSGLNFRYDTANALLRLSWNKDPRAETYGISSSGGGPMWRLEWQMSESGFPRSPLRDTTFQVALYSIGKPLYSEPVEGPLADFTVRVCGFDSSRAARSCAEVIVPAIPPNEARRSWMDWTRLGDLAFLDPGKNHRLAVKGDSLWMFQEALWCVFDSTGQCASSMRWITAWKSADGFQWIKVSDSLPYWNPVVWNDSLWALAKSGDSIQLEVSADGVTWATTYLPDAIRQVIFGSQRAPRLAWAPSGPVLLTPPSDWSMADASMGTAFQRDSGGRWSDLANLPGAHPEKSNLIETESGWWRIQQERGVIGMERLPESSEAALWKVPAGIENRLIELDGILYATCGPFNGYPNLLATSASTPSHWWRVDLPAEAKRGEGLVHWNGRLLFLDEAGTIWQGSPRASP